MTERTCSIEGCTEPHVARGWCSTHYARWKRNGDPNYTAYLTAPRSATPEDRFWGKVDKSGGCWLWLGAKENVWGGYGSFWNGVRVMPAHRFSYELANGSIPDGLLIDHICHNPPCVRPDHLRVATTAENARNARVRSDNTSGFKGVSWHRQLKAWQASIQGDGVNQYLGIFSTREEAARIYDRAARELHGEFAVTNFAA